ncbi:MAG: DUF2071 domain-containing protein [Bacteroidetes bacterium SW_9_63_38]|nr:MAG: DUF2071 domain-containing protein [Bacteroidetes bacterium SW_9_63_38]
MGSAPSSAPVILRATARHRVAAHYAVAPDRVTPHLTAGLVPDTREGRAYVSLVGVRLLGVRVLGIAGPGFRRVPAVELQVPVRPDGGDRDDRGTVTLQAYVPRRLVAWAARGLYGEPVTVASMQPVWKERPDEVEVTYRFDRAGREQRLRVTAEKPPVAPAPDTAARFLQDRHWRYGSRDDENTGALMRARMERPAGPLYRIQAHHVTVRWASAFGDAWDFLADRSPDLVLCDPGGAIVLHWRESVRK